MQVSMLLLLTAAGSISAATTFKHIHHEEHLHAGSMSGGAGLGFGTEVRQQVPGRDGSIREDSEGRVQLFQVLGMPEGLLPWPFNRRLLHSMQRRRQCRQVIVLCLPCQHTGVRL
jgi:hypothetical protein